MLSALGRAQAAAGSRPGSERGQQQLPLGGGLASGVGLRSQGGNSARFASVFSGASIPAAAVQPTPPGVQPPTGVSQTALPALPVSSASHVALGGGPAAAGHVAAGGGPTATPWALSAWNSPLG